MEASRFAPRHSFSSLSNGRMKSPMAVAIACALLFRRAMAEACFSSCITCGLHTAGSWLPSQRSHAYRLGNQAWRQLGMRSLKYDECDKRSGERQQYYCE